MLITPTASASVIIAIMRQAEPVTTKRNQTLHQYLKIGIAKIGLLKIKKQNEMQTQLATPKE